MDFRSFIAAQGLEQGFCPLGDVNLVLIGDENELEAAVFTPIVDGIAQAHDEQRGAESIAGEGGTREDGDGDQAVFGGIAGAGVENVPVDFPVVPSK